MAVAKSRLTSGAGHRFDSISWMLNSASHHAQLDGTKADAAKQPMLAVNVTASASDDALAEPIIPLPAVLDIYYHDDEQLSYVAQLERLHLRKDRLHTKC